MNTLFGICCAFLLLAVACAELKDEMKEALKPDIAACIEEQNISPSEMEKFEDYTLEGEEKKKLGCLKACVMKRMNTLVDGKPVEENMQAFVEKTMKDMPEKIPEMIEKTRQCSDQVKDITDECELAFEISRCFSD